MPEAKTAPEAQVPIEVYCAVFNSLVDERRKLLREDKRKGGRPYEEALTELMNRKCGELLEHRRRVMRRERLRNVARLEHQCRPEGASDA